MPDEYPKQIGRYQVLGELGRGGFSRVYRAYDPAVGRPAALKVLTDVTAGMLTRFQNEAKVAGNLRHHNIVTVYEYGAHDGAPFLAMEYLEGEDLHHVITSRKPLSLWAKCNIMSQVADGLHYAHGSGVIHRDIKPANIMVLPGGAVKIMDFGIARLSRAPDATRLTQQGYLIGTLRYMAPEQLTNSGFDARSDIFAYGLIFYELVTGRHPFDAPDAQSLMYKLSFGEPPPMGDLAPGTPEGLHRMILKMVQKDRSQRYQSLSEIRFDLDPVRIELQRARASELLLDARARYEEERLERAREILEEALALDAGNPAARELWETVQQTLQGRILQPRIEGLVRAGKNIW
jgi:serine/threonine-protein kinase